MIVRVRVVLTRTVGEIILRVPFTLKMISTRLSKPVSHCHQQLFSELHTPRRLTVRLTGWLAGWLAGWLVGWLAGRLAG